MTFRRRFSMRLSRFVFSCTVGGLCASCGTPEEVERACARAPNGCGPAGFLGPLVPECPVEPACFNLACDDHDNCYRECGIAKSVCDAGFNQGMLEACAEAFPNGGPELALCNAAAYIYTEAVDRFGNEIFLFTQAIGCGCENALAARVVPVDPPINVLATEAPFEDLDDDLLPDDWETRVGLDPTDPFDAMADFDDDGVNNIVEYLNRSDPFDATSP